MKKTDLVKNLAKKLDGKMKSAGTPQRFAQGSAAKQKVRAGSSPTTTKLVPVACRLPSELVNRLRDRAVGHEGGVNALIAQALTQMLDAEEPPGELRE